MTAAPAPSPRVPVDCAPAAPTLLAPPSEAIEASGFGADDSNGATELVGAAAAAVPKPKDSGFGAVAAAPVAAEPSVNCGALAPKLSCAGCEVAAVVCGAPKLSCGAADAVDCCCGEPVAAPPNVRLLGVPNVREPLAGAGVPVGLRLKPKFMMGSDGRL